MACTYDALVAKQAIDKKNKYRKFQCFLKNS